MVLKMAYEIFYLKVTSVICIVLHHNLKLLQDGRNMSTEVFSSAFLKIRKFLRNANLEGLKVFFLLYCLYLSIWI